MEQEIIKSYPDPENVWVIRTVRELKIVAHGYWPSAISRFDEFYKENGGHFLDLLIKKAPEEELS